MISIQNIKKGMKFCLPVEFERDADTGQEYWMTEVTTSDGKVHELRSACPIFFTVHFVDSFDCSRVMIGIGETHLMDVRTDYIQRYGDMIAPPAVGAASVDMSTKGGKEKAPLVLSERVYGAEGMSLVLHNAEDVATMRHVVLALHGYIVKGKPLPPLLVDPFHDENINALVTSIYEHVAEERKSATSRNGEGLPD